VRNDHNQYDDPVVIANNFVLILIGKKIVMMTTTTVILIRMLVIEKEKIYSLISFSSFIFDAPGCLVHTLLLQLLLLLLCIPLQATIRD